MSIRNLSTSFLVLTLIFTGIAFSQDSGLEEVTVTAQRQEQSLQDIPLAVSALTEDDLFDQQIEGPSDLQLTVPSLRFGSDQFSGGGGFEIRGVTNLAVSATADAGVATHVNDLAIGSTTLQDGNFFDMQRIEVIRGPAGTLFGQNSVGGALNFITAKGDTSGFYGNVRADVGDYGRLGTTAVFNIPLDDKVALRIATNTLVQDGLIENTYKGSGGFQNTDNRNQSAYRMTLTVEATDNTTINVVHQGSIEDSNRNLFAGTWCDRDPSLVVGCTPVEVQNQKFEITHPMGTFVENLLVAMGVLDFTPVTDMSGAPQEFWQVNQRGAPLYQVDEYLTQLIIEHKINDDLSLTAAASRKDRKFLRQSSYSSPTLQALRFKDTPASPGGLVVMSGYSPGRDGGFASNPAGCDDVTAGLYGLYGGCVLDTLSYPTGFDHSNALADTDSVEMKISSDYDGNHNFLIGLNYTDTFSDNHYDVGATGLDALAYKPPSLYVGPTNAALGIQLYPSLYRTDSLNTITSSSIFGEYYFQAREDLRLTFGLRYNEDYKESLSRQAFVNVAGYAPGAISDGAAAAIVGELPSSAQTDPLIAGMAQTVAGQQAGLLPAGAAAALWESVFCPSNGGFCALAGSIPDYGEVYRTTTGFDPEMEFSSTTGRFVVDYFINDDSMMYASISKGFKGGGINPAVDPIVFPNVPLAFPETNVWNVEIGFKNEFPDAGVRFNAAVFASQFDGYHVTKIIKKTSLNEGVDVDIMGAEFDLLYVPPSVPGLSVNASLSFTQSTIADGESALDPHNHDLQLTGGGKDWHLMKDVESEFFIVKKEALAAIWNSWLTETVTGGAATTPLDGIVAASAGTVSTEDLMAGLIPAEFHGDRTLGQPTPVSYLVPALGLTPAEGHLPSLADRSALGTMAQLHGFNLNPAAPDIQDGLDSDLSGNQLVHPDVMANVGLGYELDAGPVMVNFRLDYYYQGSRYVRIFNLPSDKLDPWNELSAQITVTPSDKAWFVSFYGQNITDEENIDFMGLGSSAVGNTRGIAARERARYGVRAGYNF